MRGPKRGGWTDHKAGTSGGPLEFFATYCLGWDGFPQDQDGKRILRTEVARWLGIDVSIPLENGSAKVSHGSGVITSLRAA